MYEWILYFLTWLTSLFAPPAPPQVQYVEALPQDYVGLVAVEAAYTTLLPKTVPPAPTPVDPANCTTCKGLGKIPTGDSNNPWTKCPTCKGGTGATVSASNLPSGHLPAATCESGTCSLPQTQLSSPAPAQPFTRRQVPHAH
jgi:hypothetical protein